MLESGLSHTITMERKPTRPTLVTGKRQNKKTKSEKTIQEVDAIVEKMTTPIVPDDLWPLEDLDLDDMATQLVSNLPSSSEVKEEVSIQENPRPKLKREDAICAHSEEAKQGGIQHDCHPLLFNDCSHEQGPPSSTTPLVQSADAFLTRKVQEQKCPYHKEDLKCLNPDAESGAFYFKCPVDHCITFVTDDNAGTVIRLLWETAHREIVRGWMTHLCDCGKRPFLKLSQSAKNPNRLFLCCPKKKHQNPCKYFQWVDSKPYQPKREAHRPLDVFYIGKDRHHPYKASDFQKKNQPMQGIYPYSGKPYPHESQFRRTNFEEEDRPGNQRVFREQREAARQSRLCQAAQHDLLSQRMNMHYSLEDQLKLNSRKGHNYPEFEEECRRNNERREQCGLLPYSRETFEKYGSGIF